jgi:hypothetical protein
VYSDEGGELPLSLQSQQTSPVIEMYAKQILFGKSDAFVVHVEIHLIQIKTTTLEGEPYRN